MATRALCVALLLSSLALAGCGTVANLVLVHPAEGGKTPFGGVKHDMACLNAPPAPEQCQPIGTQLLCAVDLPFTFLGDVLTWPYTASYAYINEPVPVPAPLPAPFQPVPQVPGTYQSQSAQPATPADTPPAQTAPATTRPGPGGFPSQNLGTLP